MKNKMHNRKRITHNEWQQKLSAFFCRSTLRATRSTSRGFTRTLTFVSRRFDQYRKMVRNYFSYFIISQDPTSLRRKTTRQLVSGFTIVESLVAISIFAVSLTAIISVSAEGISNATSVKNRLTATYLAQEGIEYIRALRLDGVALGFTDLPTFVGALRGSSCTLGQKCVIPSVETQLAFPVSCGNQADCSDYSMYRRDNTLGGYIFSDTIGGGGTKLVFNRYITLDTPVGAATDDQLIVTSTVTWIDRGGTIRTTVLTETLTDWIPVTP